MRAKERERKKRKKKVGGKWAKSGGRVKPDERMKWKKKEKPQVTE